MIPMQCVLTDSAPKLLGPGQYVIRLVAPEDQRLLATIPIRIPEEGTLYVTRTRVTLRQGNAEQVLYG